MSRLQNGEDPYDIFDEAYGFVDGFAQVNLNDKWNFIDENGNFLSNQWFDFVEEFDNGLARVKLNDKWNYMNANGQIILNQWFDDVYDFDGGFAEVKINGEWFRIDKNGNLHENKQIKLLTKANLTQIVLEVLNNIKKEIRG